MFRRPSTWWAAFCAWFAVLWILSAQPPHNLPGPRIPHFDKVAHVTLFACGGALLGTALAVGTRAKSARARTSEKLPAFALPAPLALLALIGALDEWHQVFTAGRQGADPWDWLADVAGGAAGLALVRFIESRLRR